MSFIYPIMTPFSKITYYLSKFSRALKLVLVKKHVFLNFIEKYLSAKKKFDVIIPIIIGYA